MEWLIAAEEGSTNVLRLPLYEVIIGLAAFLIVFGLLAKVLLPRIQQTLAEREDAIQGGIERAAEAEAQARADREQLHADLAAAKQEANEIRQQAHAEKAQIIEEARAQARQAEELVSAQAAAQRAADAAKAQAELQRSVGAMASALAGKIVGESLTDDQRASAVIDRFIADLETTSAPAEGQA